MSILNAGMHLKYGGGKTGAGVPEKIAADAAVPIFQKIPDGAALIFPESHPELHGVVSAFRSVAR